MGQQLSLLGERPNSASAGLQRLGWVVLSIVVANIFLTELAGRAFGRSGFAAVPVVRAGTAALTLGLLVSWWLLSNQWNARFSSSRRTGVLALLMVVWLCLGLYYGSPLGYVASDTFFLFHSIVFLLFFHTYFCRAATRWAADFTEGSGPFDQWFTMPIWLILIAAAGSFAVRYQALPPSIALVVIVTMVALLLTSKYDFRLFVCVIFMLSYVSSGNRATLITAVIALLCGLYISPRQRLIQVSAVLVLLVAGLSSISEKTGWAPGNQIDRAVETWNSLMDAAHGGRIEELPMPLYQRVFEARLVSEKLDSGGVVPAVFGYGAGASLDMSGSYDTSVAEASLLGLESVHNIHLLPYMVLYRFGLAGLVVLGMLIYSMVKHIVVFRRKFAHDRTHLGSLLAATYVLAWLGYAFPASGFIFENPLMFVCIAAVWAAERTARFSERPFAYVEG